jgi:hypothetical protein
MLVKGQSESERSLDLSVSRWKPGVPKLNLNVPVAVKPRWELGAHDASLFAILNEWLEQEPSEGLQTGKTCFLPVEDLETKAGDLVHLAFALRLSRDTWHQRIGSMYHRIREFEEGDFGNPDDATIPRVQRLRVHLVEIRTELKRLDGLQVPTMTPEDSFPIRPIDFDELKALYHEAESLSDRLRDDIQLVIGGIQLKDSKESKKQAQRATLLTVLAAVYLPLSLSASIFSMGIKEVNPSSFLGWRDVVYAVVVVRK